MYANVTPAQFQRLRELAQLEGLKDASWLRTQMIGQLSSAVLDNGGDFNAALARVGVETELRVISCVTAVQQPETE
jgi:hypothetical protein